MPREQYRMLTVTVGLDLVGRVRALALIAEVQASYHRYEERVYGSRGASDVTTAYVLTGAASVGLNRWTLRLTDVPKRAVFAPQAAQGIEATSVAVLEHDVARASKLAELLDVRLELVIGAAICSGLALLSGVDANDGPFEVPGGA